MVAEKPSFSLTTPDSASVVNATELVHRNRYLHDQRQGGRRNRSSPLWFGRWSNATGDNAYFSKSWKDQAKAFASIRDDLA